MSKRKSTAKAPSVPQESSGVTSAASDTSPATGRLRLEYRSPAELADNPKNWRKHGEQQTAALQGVLSEVGWAGACLYNERTGRLIDGHLRRKVAQMNGAETIPVLIGSWSEADEAKILASLDPIAGLAEADPVALDQLLREVNTGCEELQQMLTDLWEEAQADALANTETADPKDAEPQTDRAAELLEKWGVRQGDLWLLGRHRLLCGDSTKPEDVALVMGADKALLTVADPPFELDREQVLSAVFTMCSRDTVLIMSNRLVFAIAEHSPQQFMFDLCVKRNSPFLIRNTVHYVSRNHFYVLVFSSDDPPGFTKGIDSAVYQPSLLEWEWSGETEKLNPFSKPVSGWMQLLGFYPQHECVYDPFLGSGTTMIAAENLGRRCFGIEISPAYCAVILQRFQDAFGDQEIRKSE